MKISELIKEIVLYADDKFDVSDHINDAITVSITPPNLHIGIYDWQVSLDRPTQRYLDRGEVEDGSTIKVIEYRVNFFTEAPTLMEALRLLKQEVEETIGDFKA